MINYRNQKELFLMNHNPEKTIFKNINNKKDYINKVQFDITSCNLNCIRLKNNIAKQHIKLDNGSFNFILHNKTERKQNPSSLITEKVHSLNKEFQDDDSIIYHILNIIACSGGTVIVKQEMIFNLIPRLSLHF